MDGLSGAEGIHTPNSHGYVVGSISIPVGVPLVLDDQVLLMDGLQQSRGQGLEVRDGLRRDWQAAGLLFQEHLLD
ncbi:hypothetical protein EYF80_034441 [Liparis tanakae]|uniref:Uncharacterized protein n=1 Tax=Liparis tanakae TaxID=230148 RepID=A0A4Z2GNZ7_9TELE|nr:hypothetical protein EYF80_034441 [Liparis tanakae]